MPCLNCNGTGEVDSGGVSQWDTPINVACPYCKGTGKGDWRIGQRNALLGAIKALQDSIDYAAPEMEGHYRRRRDRYLREADELTEELKREGLL